MDGWGEVSFNDLRFVCCVECILCVVYVTAEWNLDVCGCGL